MFRLIHLILLIIAAIFLSPLFALPLAVLYSFRYYAPELVIIGLLLDVYFGVVSNWPEYTIFAFIIVIVGEMARRYIIK